MVKVLPVNLLSKFTWGLVIIPVKSHDQQALKSVPFMLSKIRINNMSTLSVYWNQE